MSDEILKNGYIGKLAGYRVNGKSYDAEGNEVEEEHEDDCLCCRKNLFTPTKETLSNKDIAV